MLDDRVLSQWRTWSLQLSTEHLPWIAPLLETQQVIYLCYSTIGQCKRIRTKSFVCVNVKQASVFMIMK